MSAESDREMNTLPLHIESSDSIAQNFKSTGVFRALREAKGYSVEDVAARLKFTARQIQWLEEEDFEKLPRGVALKGMVKNYAKLVDIDSSAMLETLQPLIGNVSGGISQHTSIRTLGKHESAHTSGGGTMIWLLLILIVLSAAVGIAIWQGMIPQSWLPSWIGAMFK